MNDELLNQSLIATFDTLGLRVSGDEGHWLAAFGPTPTRPSVDVRLDIEGNGTVLSMRSHGGVAYALNRRRDLLEAVNRWHEDRRWPRLFVHQNAEGLTIEADHHHPVPPDGAESPDFDVVVGVFIRSSLEFWETFFQAPTEHDVLEGLARILDEADLDATPD